MKGRYLFFLLLFIGFSGCDKSAKIIATIPDGTYFGTFQRILTSGEGQKANIWLTFSSGRWSGQSDIPNYPALCHGTYKAVGEKLIFENECAFTADFDWSLILSGEYKYTLDGDNLTITKSYGIPATETYSDAYSVSRPKTGIKKSPIDGTWVESVLKTDTIVFSPEYDGQFPVFNLKRAKGNSEGYTLPGYCSGPYNYILGENSISVNWFLSSNSAYNRYYFEMMPEGKELKIGTFFSDPPEPMKTDTLTFIKIN